MEGRSQKGFGILMEREISKLTISEILELIRLLTDELELRIMEEV